MATRHFNQAHISKPVIYTIAVLIAFLFASPIRWYGGQLLLDPYKGLMVAILPLAWFRRFRSMVHLKPGFAPFPTSLFWLSVFLYLINENYLGVHIFSATLFVVVFYSLLGMTLSRQQWWELFLPFCLVILLLPFEGYLDIYLGFPLRLLCAEWAGEVLQAFGISSMSHESIIMIEEKAANVDLGCSGIKGLWAGSIFYLFLSMIKGSRVSLRWFVVGVGFLACLLMANVFRIVVLVFLGLVADLSTLASLVHLALGLVGFSISCLLAWLGLKLTFKKPVQKKKESTCEGSRAIILQVMFITGLVVAIWLHHPYRPDAANASFSPYLPDDLHPAMVQLSDFERDFFQNNHASTRKMKIAFEDMTGSILIVNSRYWKGQHEPRNCYIGHGYKLAFEGSWLLSNDTVVRFMEVDEANKTAIYWFQSLDQVTPNYSSRVFSGIRNRQNTWLMVSILWDSPVNQGEIEKLLLRIQASLADQLKVENKDEE